jgi:hypothetical protein
MLTYVKPLQWSSKPQEDAFRNAYSKQGIKVSVSRGLCSESSAAVSASDLPSDPYRSRIQLRIQSRIRIAVPRTAAAHLCAELS